VADWKQHHANEAEKVNDFEPLQRAMREYADNMGFKLEGLPAYGLGKVVSIAAQVARAEALGFDPHLLLFNRDEADEQALKLAQMAAESGKPVWAINLDTGGDHA
jgi:hypothetical protein